MFSAAFRVVVESAEAEKQPSKNEQRFARRQLRDASNPLELPQTLFEKYYRVNKPAFKYLLDILTSYSQPRMKSFAVSPIVELSAVLRFFAEGGYQTGIEKDSDVSVAQCTMSKYLKEVIDIFEEKLCPNWITFPIVPFSTPKHFLMEALMNSFRFLSRAKNGLTPLCSP